ncbi:MAG: type II toxin-antitoxin system prevent-host-death family antitoxin [Rhodospirillaceae bacterium]|nr:type II toxin-antitoxin system prevent-host-death family antitoxin [Rhodospirillaceae bacterium]
MTVTKSVGLFEAKTHLSALVDEASKGAVIEITRRGVPVARLMQTERKRDPAEAARVIARIKEQRKGISLGGLSIKDLINEGRKY